MMQYRDENTKYGIGIIKDLNEDEIKKLADDSKNFICPECNKALGDYTLVPW